ncbi:MAG: KpsF/GutQ family sugar-phosphate isomerase [Betaproteobacteria bacterium]|nr:MAG: KpsF/GutQ family sugar-phosphate isomerase [Betaproteobacteria bacterium]
MDKILPSKTALELAKQVLAIEAEAIQGLAARLGQSFLDAVALLLNCKGRVVVSGIGKSGHIARKIASTMASTGTPAYFVHTAEASHGDIGMIARDDVLIALSNSGETEELLTILPMLKRQGAHLIAITGNANSTLARQADVHLDARVDKEACPLNLAPTASTTAALALGDALAVALLDAKGFGAEDFARSHPGGTLGRRLLTHVRDVMRSGDDIPAVTESVGFSEALLEMSKKRMGMTAVLDAAGRVSGVFTDGDLRRTLAQVEDIRRARIVDIMTRSPRTIGPDKLAVEAVQIMEQRKVNQLLVVDGDGRLVGALNMHDLFRAKVI